MLKFKPTVTVQKEYQKPIKAIVVDDMVEIDSKLYAITDKSKSIKGFKVFYDIVNRLKIIKTRAYMGICSKYRPYKNGQIVTGVLNDNQKFVIKYAR